MFSSGKKHKKHFNPWLKKKLNWIIKLCWCSYWLHLDSGKYWCMTYCWKMFQIDTLLSSCCFISVNNVLQLIYDDVRAMCSCSNHLQPMSVYIHTCNIILDVFKLYFFLDKINNTIPHSDLCSLLVKNQWHQSYSCVIIIVVVISTICSSISSGSTSIDRCTCTLDIYRLK